MTEEPQQQQEHPSSVLVDKDNDMPMVILEAEPYEAESQVVYHAEAQVIDDPQVVATEEMKQKQRHRVYMGGACMAAVIVIIVAIVVALTMAGGGGGRKSRDGGEEERFIHDTVLPMTTGAPTPPQPTAAPTKGPWDACFNNMVSLRYQLRARREYDTPVEAEICKCARERTSNATILLSLLRCSCYNVFLVAPSNKRVVRLTMMFYLGAGETIKVGSLSRSFPMEGSQPPFLVQSNVRFSKCQTRNPSYFVVILSGLF